MLGVCPNTIHNMIKAGLPVIEGSYPYLIMGEEAIIFIKARQEKTKVTLKDEELRCFRCRKGTRAKNSEAVLQIISPKIGNLKAACDACGLITNRRISLKKLPEFYKIFKVQQLPDPRLIQSLDNSTICETKKEWKNA